MSTDGNENPPPTIMCRMGCGFYASSAFDGMCSACYKDSIKRKQASPTISHTAHDFSNPGRAIVNSVASSCKNQSANTPNLQQPQIPTGANAKDALTVPTASTTASSSSEAPSTTGACGADGQATEQKAKKRRCGVCNKKLPLTAIECRCGKLFCGLHRYPAEHSCEFDYKSHGREKLGEILGEKCEAQKVAKIGDSPKGS